VKTHSQFEVNNNNNNNNKKKMNFRGQLHMGTEDRQVTEQASTDVPW
jgi:hypothetical protein